MSETVLARHDALPRLLARPRFFIGGAPRSGTTWLQLLLNAHPEISCRGEGHFFDGLLPRLEQAIASHNAVVAARNHTLAEAAAAYPAVPPELVEYLHAAAIAMVMDDDAGDVRIVGEKTPDNVLWFARLAALFPAARFVILVRDGRDCAVSTWFINQHLDADAARAKFPSLAEFIAVFAPSWADYVDSGLRFAGACPERCLTLTYEALVAAPLAVMTRVFGFLGVTADSETVRHCLAAAAFSRLTGGRPRGQEDRTSLFRRGVVGGWQDHFDRDMCLTFEHHAGAQLRRCGYPLTATNSGT